MILGTAFQATWKYLTEPGRTLALLIVAAAMCCLPNVTWAQGADPFGSGEDETEAAADAPAKPAAAGTSALAPNSHPIVQSFRDEPPKTPSQYAKAILYMSRIEQWEELGRYLDEMARLNITDAQAAEMLTQIGSAEWLAIRSKALNLTESQQAQLKRVLDGAAKHTRQPAALAQYRQLLNAPKMTDQKRGLLGLQSAGDQGISYLLTQVMASATKPLASESAVVKSFEDQGIFAVQAALLTSEAKQREQLFRLIAPLNPRPYLNEYLAAAYATSDTDETHKLAQQALSQILGSVPSVEQCRVTINARLRERLKVLCTAESTMSTATREDWRWNGQTLLFQYDDERQFELNRCMQLANSLRLVTSATNQESAEAFAVFLENESRVAKDVDVAALAERCEAWSPGVAQSPNFLQLTWQTAKANSLFGAQELCVILLSQLPAELYDVAALEVLNQACESGVPAIRYQAATALMPLLLQREFRGALRAQEVIVEMLRLDGNALVLVIGTNPSLSMHASAVLSQMGLRVVTATAGQDALRAVEDGFPVEYILLVDRTGDIALTQLVQRLRSHFRSSIIPMAVLLPEYRSGEVPLLNEVSGLVASFVPPDDAGMINILLQCNELPKQRQRLTNADRIAWKTTAKDFLNRIASMPSNEIPSSLRSWSEFARENLDQAIVNKIDNEVLAEMGNLEGQRELTRRLIAAGSDAELRLAIGELLKRSVRFHGVKMSRADVESLYDAYNKQGPTDPAAARAIGEVIDAVELFAKENGWDSIVSDSPSIATK